MLKGAVDTIRSEAPVLPNPSSTPIRQVIQDELASVRKNHRDLMTAKEPKNLHIFVVMCCILVNAVLYFLVPLYLELFIAASFYLNMFYFITLLIPLSPGSARMPKTDISRFRSFLHEMGVKGAANRVSRVFLNAFFIGSQTLFIPITLLFLVDIVFILAEYFNQKISFQITIIMIAQACAFILFYFIIWKFEPYSTKFTKDIERVKSRLSEELPQWLINVIIIIGAVLALFLIGMTIFLLPGMAVNAFLDHSRLADLGNLFANIAILAVSQYFVVRYIHGYTSRAMAERIFNDKEERLQQLGETREKTGTEALFLHRNPEEVITLLLESKIFQLARNSLSGAFPVYVVMLDFSVIMDSSTLTTFRGYIQETKGKAE
jgi:ABC-type multidrug transport system fused ATPase/permease subunit